MSKITAAHITKLVQRIFAHAGECDPPVSRNTSELYLLALLEGIDKDLRDQYPHNVRTLIENIAGHVTVTHDREKNRARKMRSQKAVK